MYMPDTSFRLKSYQLKINHAFENEYNLAEPNKNPDI